MDHQGARPVTATTGLGGWTSADCELRSILAELPGVSVIDRTSMNAFEDRAFSDAVKKTGRRAVPRLAVTVSEERTRGHRVVFHRGSEGVQSHRCRRPGERKNRCLSLG